MVLTLNAEDFYAWLIAQAKTAGDGPVSAMAQGYSEAANKGKLPPAGLVTPEQLAKGFASSVLHSGAGVPAEGVAAAYWAAYGAAETFARLRA